MSSWASIDWPETPQHPLSTRAISPDTDEDPLLKFDWLAESSPYTWAMPQYTLASTQTRYLRSDLLYPAFRRSVIVLPMLSSPAAVSWTSRTDRLHDESVTYRTWRTPPVSPALVLKTVSTCAAHCRIDEATWADRSVTSAAWA